MDLTDERFHRRKVPWASLVKEGIEPQAVVIEAQRQGLWKLAESAATRIRNCKNGSA